MGSALCATCEIEVPWPPVVAAGRTYCCHGCAGGGPCCCSYDDPPEEASMNSTNVIDRLAADAAPSLPMTRSEYRRLEAEIDRLADELLQAQGNALEANADADAGTPAVDGQLHLLSQRLESLRRALPEAMVVEPNGAAVVGSRVTVRDFDSLDSYVLAAPGDADLQAGRISPESPLGAALLGRRAGEEVDVTAPAGSRRVSVVAVI